MYFTIPVDDWWLIREKQPGSVTSEKRLNKKLKSFSGIKCHKYHWMMTYHLLKTFAIYHIWSLFFLNLGPAWQRRRHSLVAIDGDKIREKNNLRRKDKILALWLRKCKTGQGGPESHDPVFEESYVSEDYMWFWKLKAESYWKNFQTIRAVQQWWN